MHPSEYPSEATGEEFFFLAGEKVVKHETFAECECCGGTGFKIRGVSLLPS